MVLRGQIGSEDLGQVAPLGHEDDEEGSEDGAVPLDADSSRAICELAGVVDPRAGDEDWNVKNCAPYLPADWPEGFWAVVVRARDGEVRLLGADDALPLARGVAASAAAPGLTNAVRIGRDLFFDGGARSATNADLAIKFHLDRCLVLSPVPSDAPFVGAATARVLEEEVRRLRCEGTAVAVMVPGDLEAAAFGWNLIDRSKVREAIETGLQRGRRDGATLSSDSGLRPGLRGEVLSPSGGGPMRGAPWRQRCWGDDRAAPTRRRTSWL